MVGTDARMRVSSVIFWASSSGTLRSARTNTFFPFRSASPRVPTLLLVAITPCTHAPRENPAPRGSDSSLEPDGGGSGGRLAIGGGDSPRIGLEEPDRAGGERDEEIGGGED